MTDSADEAEDFYEEDEDPASVRARFEAGEKFITTRPAGSPVEDVRP
jgi:hypothetical protein